MFGSLDSYVVAFFAALVVTLIATPLIRRVALRFGVVDLPNERRPHKRPTPRGGGLAVVIGVQAANLLTLIIFRHTHADAFGFRWWETYTLASTLLVIVGVIDDVRGLNPVAKLCGQAAAAIIISRTGTSFGTIFGLALPPALDSAFVVIWIVAIINAFNLIDGLDGLASGLAIISAIGLCGVFGLGQLPGDVVVLAALIGACLGFLRYNFHPASIFLGDSGSMFIGFTLGVLSLQTLTKSTFVLSMTIPLLVLWRARLRHFAGCVAAIGEAIARWRPIGTQWNHAA